MVSGLPLWIEIMASNHTQIIKVESLLVPKAKDLSEHFCVGPCFILGFV